MTTRVLRVDPLTPDDAVLAEAAAIVAGGGVVAYPTDTLYALAVDPRSDAAVDRLYRVKGRDVSVAVPLIAGSFGIAAAAGAFSDADLRLARAFWPGPLSIVVPPSRALSQRLLGTGATVAVRVPAHTVARALSLALGATITSTSANLSGVPPTTQPDAVIDALGDRIDAILDAGASPGGPPSTIVEIVDGTWQLRRAGAIAFDRVLEFAE